MKDDNRVSPPVRPDSAVEAEPRNLLTLALHQVVLRIAWVFKTESVIMPAFLDSISGAGWVRGCLPILNRAGQSIPPMLLADRIRSMPRKKWALAGGSALMGLSFLVLAIAWMAVNGQRAAWMVPAFLVVYCLFFVCTGLTTLSQGTLQGKLIRPNRRGRLMALAGIAGSLTSIPCAWFLLGHWLNAPTTGFAYIFSFTGLGFVLAGLLATTLSEQRDVHESNGRPRARVLDDTRRLLRTNAAFRRVALTAVLFMTLQLLFPHFQALGRTRLPTDVMSEQLMIWVVAQNAGVGILSPLAGWIADRLGNRAAVRLETSLATIVPVLAIVSQSPVPFAITFFVLGLVPVTMRTLVNYTLELSGPEDHPRLVSTLSLCMAVPFLASPLIGWLVDRVGYTAVFGTITITAALSGLSSWWLIEPRHTPSTPGRSGTTA